MESRSVRVWPGLRLLTALLRPAVALMNRLKFPQKFAVISVLFGMPLAVMMGVLIVDIHQGIAFTAREQTGTQLVRPLRQVLEWVPLHAAMVDSEAGHQAAGARKRIEIEIDREFATVRALDQSSRDLLSVAGQVDRLRETWQLAKYVPAGPVADALHEGLDGQIRGLIQAIADRSNLVLDPELEISYLLESVLLKLPESVKLLARANEICQVIATTGGLSPGQRAELTSLIVLIRANEQALAQERTTAFYNNASLGLGPKLAASLRIYQASVDRFRGELDGLVGHSKRPLEPEEAGRIKQAGRSAIKTGFHFWDQSRMAR